MADSDSGTHISDITENNAEIDTEAKMNEERLESIEESTTTIQPRMISLDENTRPKKTANEEAIELKNIRNLSDTTASIDQESTPNTRASRKHTHVKMDPQPTAVQEHRTRSQTQSVPGDNHVTIAHVHSAPRVYRKVNGNLAAVPKQQARRQRSLPPRWSQNGNGLSRGIDNLSFNRSFEGIHGGPRTAYDFMEAEVNGKNKRPAVIDVDMNDRRESLDTRDDIEDDSSWAPTGIFAVFVVTLWTAVLKLIDSIESNGPVKCSEGEEVRLWICAGCLSLVFCLAEVTWKKKSIFKALFGTVLVFTYMMLGHAEPLSCRLGEARLPEIGKWQAAMNFFFAALLGTRVYQEIAESIREKRKRRRAKKQRRENGMQEDWSDEDSSATMRVYRVRHPANCSDPREVFHATSL